MAVSLFVGVWVARYLGPDQFGVYSYALAFTVFFGALAGFGLQGVVNRELVRKPEDKQTILGTAILILLCSGLLAYALCMLIVFLIRPEDRLVQVLVAIVASGFLFRFADAFKAYYDSRVEAKYIVYMTTLSFVVSSILKVVLIWLKAPLVYFAFPIAVDAIIVGVGLLLLVAKHNISWSSFKVDYTLAKQFIKDSYPLILSSIMALLYMKIDQVMLGEMTTDEEVGLYSVGVRLAEIWFFVPAIIQTSTFPGILKAKERGQTFFDSKMLNLYRTVTLIGYSLAIVTTLIGHWLVVCLYGEVYAPAGIILIILIWSVPFAGLGIARGTLIYAENWMQLHFKILLVGCVINIVMNYFFIPIYGGVGAAVASLLTHLYSGFLCCFFFKPLWGSIRLKSSALLYPIPKY